MATTKKLKEANYVYVENDGEGLKRLLQQPDLKPLHHIGAYASGSLLDSLKEFIG